VFVKLVDSQTQCILKKNIISINLRTRKSNTNIKVVRKPSARKVAEVTIAMSVTVMIL